MEETCKNCSNWRVKFNNSEKDEKEDAKMNFTIVYGVCRALEIPTKRTHFRPLTHCDTIGCVKFEPRIANQPKQYIHEYWGALDDESVRTRYEIKTTKTWDEFMRGKFVEDFEQIDVDQEVSNGK